MGACGGSTPVLLEGNVVQSSGEVPGGWPGPGLPGDKLHTPGRCLTPPITRSQHCYGISTSLLLVSQSISDLRKGAQIATVCLHQRSQRGIHGAGLHITCRLQPHEGGGLLFAPMVWSLKTPYPGANSWVSKSTLAPPGPDYKMWAHKDLIPLVA